MATAFKMASKPKFQRRLKHTVQVLHGRQELSPEDGRALLLSVTERMDARRIQRRLERTKERLSHSPERQSVAVAMLAVEEQIVKAYSVLGRSVSNPTPHAPRQHGIGYPMEREDVWAAAVASGGFLSEEPLVRPTASEIDKSDGPLEWLQMLDLEQRKIVSAAARSKVGDVSRPVRWAKVKLQLPAYKDWKADRLNKVYKDGLRRIAVGLAHV